MSKNRSVTTDARRTVGLRHEPTTHDCFVFCQIIGVEIADEGAYSCVADNGRGVPPQAQVTLAVDSPTRWARLFTPRNVPIGSIVLEEAAHLPDLGTSVTCSMI